MTEPVASGALPRINRYSAIPLYLQLKELLLYKIRSGEFPPNGAIPPEREIEVMYGVSRTTVRQAVGDLVSEGHLYRIQGKGTFVARPKLQHGLRHLTSFTEDLQSRGLTPGSQVLEVSKVVPSVTVAQKLAVAPKEQVLKVERLRLINGEPCGLHTAYLPLRYGWNITAALLAERGSLYAILEEQYHISLQEADQVLEATLATAREARLLGVRKGSPLLLIERTTYSLTGEPVEFVKMLYRGDRYQYHVHLTR